MTSANNGLFAEQSFKKDDIICFYLRLVNSPSFIDGNNEYLIGYQNCKIGLPRDIVTNSQFGLSAHFCNDITFTYRETKGVNPTCLKQNNAKLDGLNLICDCYEISSGNEIFFNYNREQLNNKDMKGFMATRNLFDDSDEENWSYKNRLHIFLIL